MKRSLPWIVGLAAPLAAQAPAPFCDRPAATFGPVGRRWVGLTAPVLQPK